MKRIATIQDFSCVGKCSLTVALPIISAAGVECCCVPTAVLSNHTGFPRFYVRDLTEDLERFSEEFKANEITFDAIYTGYLASSSQVEYVLKFIGDFRRENSCVLIDPVMGDDGTLYPQITKDYAEKMRGLCAEADIITPNLTEAYLLLDKEYHKNPDEAEIEEMLRGLLRLGTKRAVITGISEPLKEGQIGWYAIENDGSIFKSFSKEYDIHRSGTGDIFSSALLAATMRGKDFTNALRIADAFTTKSVELTANDDERRFYGVNFEAAIPLLVELLNID
ncbi:MAG: pyridoxamine kinase [Oscillospiraceae bacterium]